jgi:hypothetical protein
MRNGGQFFPKDKARHFLEEHPKFLCFPAKPLRYMSSTATSGLTGQRPVTLRKSMARSNGVMS